MILPAQTIRKLALVYPTVERTNYEFQLNKKKWMTLTFGISAASYDVRLDEPVVFRPSKHIVVLASTHERFSLPADIAGSVKDKSSWARRGLFVQNTFIDPGFFGYLTLELTYQGHELLILETGTPIAQVVFERLEAPTELPYDGKYQDQQRGPQEAR